MKNNQVKPLMGRDDHPEIGARLDRLGSSRTVWILVALLALGGFLEAYLLITGSGIAPGLFKSGLLSSTTTSFFSMEGYAGFTSATFVGLLAGLLAASVLANKFGRRKIFLAGLVWFSFSGLAMAFQSSTIWLVFWRFMLAVGAGVEVVTIDAYLTELMPKTSRGKAIAFNNAIHSLAKPIGAFATFALVPHVFFGLDGWRWVLLLGAGAALLVWPFRRMIPESPRWLAARGQFGAADSVVAALEARVMREKGKPLPPPEPTAPPPEPVSHGPSHQTGRYLELFSKEYLPRTLMLSIFNVLWAICIFGYLNWMPILLMNQGLSITHSLGYTFVMTLAAPLGPLAIMPFADKIERKWQIAGSALIIAAIGIVFAITQNPYIIIPVGALQVLFGAIFAYSFQTYQAELFPTRIRTQGIGFVYSWSRLSAILSGFIIAYIMKDYGVPAVFMLLSASMVLVVFAIALFGPISNNKSLETLSP